MDRTIKCECCGADVAATTGNQRTCLSDKCRKWLRSETRKRRYYEARPTPICVWCEEPIHEPRARRYHRECRDDKNRERVREYNRANKPRQVPKKTRSYSGHLHCKFCRKKVERTGARQIICKEKVCINKLKQLRKKEARERRKRLEALRTKKQSKRDKRSSDRDIFDRPEHRVAV